MRNPAESSLFFNMSFNLLIVSNRRKASPTLNRVAKHWPINCRIGGPGLTWIWAWTYNFFLTIFYVILEKQHQNPWIRIELKKILLFTFWAAIKTFSRNWSHSYTKRDFFASGSLARASSFKIKLWLISMIERATASLEWSTRWITCSFKKLGFQSETNDEKNNFYCMFYIKKAVCQQPLTSIFKFLFSWEVK